MYIFDAKKIDTKFQHFSYMTAGALCFNVSNQIVREKNDRPQSILIETFWNVKKIMP